MLPQPTIIACLCMLSTLTLTVSDAFAEDADLKLFDKDASWKVTKNGGSDGTFEIVAEGDSTIGVMTYDFANRASNKPSVLVAASGTSINAEAGAVALNARTSRPLTLTIRFVDDTGQTHQHKSKLKGSGDWETVRISLSRKFETWGGAGDGKIHFPIKQVKLALLAPKDDPPTGKIEFAKAVAIAE